MKIISRLLKANSQVCCICYKHVLLVVSILSFALKSPARCVSYNYRTIVELSALQRGSWPFAHIHMQQLVNILV